MSTTTSNPVLVNKDALAATLSVSKSTVEKLMTKGMPYIKIGKSARFEVQEVLAWIKGQNK